jgi:hypothetical protein
MKAIILKSKINICSLEEENHIPINSISAVFNLGSKEQSR